MDERNLSFYGILTYYFDKNSGEIKKEILLFNDGRHEQVDSFDEFVAHLDAHEGYKLQNRVIKLENNEKIVMWEVGNTKFSRKDFEKIMTQFY